MAVQLSTRLRYIRGVTPDELTEFVELLPYRVQIYSMSHDGTAWFLWFVPPDDIAEVQPNLDLETV